MNKDWERKRIKANWLERNGYWYGTFKGVLLAGILLSLLNWGGILLYEYLTTYWQHL